LQPIELDTIGKAEGLTAFQHDHAGCGIVVGDDALDFAGEGSPVSQDSETVV
jgi:hypothetical protein